MASERRGIVKDELGNRMKKYEAASNQTLTHRMPVFIRVDGKAFHTFTKECDKPFDHDVMDAMVYAAKRTAEQMQGFKLAYVQSDEATFMISDTDTLETMPWFGNEVNKLVSITASSFTAHFGMYLRALHNSALAGARPAKPMYTKIAMFDARAFNVPIEDAPNNFVWRQRDWERNSIQMFARSHFSHKQLEGKSILDMRMMLLNINVDDTLRTDQEKYGTFIERDLTVSYNKETYETIETRF